MKKVVDRKVQYPNRYQLFNVSNGQSLGTFDFEPVPGTIMEEGTEINAELFDSIDEDIKQASDKIDKEVSLQKTKYAEYYFLMHKTGKIFGVSFDGLNPNGTRLMDAVGMVAEPSTDTVKARNDFDDYSIFNGMTVNGYVDENGDFIVTYFENEDGFSNAENDTYVLFGTSWVKIDITADGESIYVTDKARTGYFPMGGAVRPDGSIRPFIAMAKYMASEGTDGKPASVSGKTPYHSISYNSAITIFHNKGNQYCATTFQDRFLIQTLFQVVFATRNSQSIMAGCTNYNYQYNVVKGETGDIGINLLKNTKNGNLPTAYYNSTSTSVEQVPDLNTPSGNVIKITSTLVNSGSVGGCYYQYTSLLGDNGLGKLIEGETYTLSFYAKVDSGSITLSPNYLPQTQTRISISDLIVSTEWKQFRSVFRYTDTSQFTLGFYQKNVPSYTLFLSSMKLEVGSIDNPVWTPAPQDLEYEKGVQRVILTKAQADNFIVGSSVSVGDVGSNTNYDRSQSYMHNLANRVKVIDITTENIDDSDVGIVWLDCTPIQTTATTYISTMPWATGACDNVLGSCGSFVDNTNSKYPFIFLGIEMMNGQYEIIGNVIYKQSGASGLFTGEYYVCYDATKLATASSNANYKKVGYSVNVDDLSAAKWKYTSKFGFDKAHPSSRFPNEVNAISTSGYCDGCYLGVTAQDIEILVGGRIDGGALAGIWCNFLGYNISLLYWGISARLSATGICGEVAA